MKAFIPTVAKYTQAQITAGAANNDKAQFIIVVDGSGVPVSPQVIYQGTGNGTAPSTVATSASVAAAVAAITVSDWTAGAVVITNELRRAVVAAGTIEAGDLIRSNSGRTTGTTFDATEAANWTEIAPDLVTSVAGRTGAVVIAESDVANLTSDLAAKAPIASPTFTGTVGGVTSTMVGLGNVTNTSDANKPVSTAQQTALNLKQDTLVSGTSIKTVNSTSLLGSGDIAITQTITNTVAPILTGSTVVTALAILATTDWDKQIPVDATTGNITIQLPTAVGNNGKSIRIVRLDSSVNTVLVQARYDEGIGGIQTGADVIGLKATGMITVKSNGTQPVLAAWENPASVSRLWLPNDLAGQVGWYRPDGLAAGLMATWTDAFGLNNITAAGTAPTVATGGQNGYAKIGFNGASNMLSVGSVNLDTLTIMGIFTPVAAAYHNILRGNNTNGFSLGSNNANPMTIVMGQRGVVNFTASTATWAIGSPALFGATYDAAGVYTYYKDGANGGTATDNRLMATQPIDIASNTNMDYYEQIIYTTVQVAADIDRLSGYLAHKYSLTANLAGGHTYKTLPPVISLATY